MWQQFNRLAGFFRSNYLVKATGLIGFSQVISAIAGFGVMTLFTQKLTAADYGKASLVWLYVTILSLPIDARLNTAFCIRFYKVSEVEVAKNIYTSLIFNFFATLVLCITMIIFQDFFSTIMNLSLSVREIGLLCLISLAMVIVKFFYSLLLITKRNKLYFVFTFLFNFSLILASLILLRLPNINYLTYLYSHLTAYFLLTLLTFHYILSKFPFKAATFFCRGCLASLLKLSFPLIPDAMLLMIISGSGRYILGLYSSFEHVAVYSVAYMFANIFNLLIMGPLGQALTPILYELFAKSTDSYKKSLELIFKYYWILFPSVILLFFTFFPEIFPLFVNPEYQVAFNLLVIMMFGLLISGGGGVLSTTIVLKEKTAFSFLITSVSAVTSICVNLFLAEYNAYGAAIACLASFSVQGLLVIYFTQCWLPVNLNPILLFKNALLFLLVAYLYYLIGRSGLNTVTMILLKLIVWCINFGLVLKMDSFFMDLRLFCKKRQ